MSLFDHLVDQAMRNQNDLAPLRMVVGTAETPGFWQYATASITNECQRATAFLLSGGDSVPFKM